MLYQHQTGQCAKQQLAMNIWNEKKVKKNKTITCANNLVIYYVFHAIAWHTKTRLFWSHYVALCILLIRRQHRVEPCNPVVYSVESTWHCISTYIHHRQMSKPERAAFLHQDRLETPKNENKNIYWINNKFILFAYKRSIMCWHVTQLDAVRRRNSHFSHCPEVVKSRATPYTFSCYSGTLETF